MQDISIRFVAGPMAGSSAEFEVGRLIIGRLPGAGGLELKHADSSVSRVHAELIEDQGKIEIKNHSSNGTTVSGNLVLDSAPIEPGAQIQIGDDHVFEVHWASFDTTDRKSHTEGKGDEPSSQGILASPVVRTVMAVYLLGMVAVGVWVSGSGSGGEITDDWPGLASVYASYQPKGISPDVLAQRATQAEFLVRKLRVSKTLGQGNEVEKICREIMSLDGDHQSPLFQYGAACLGSH